MKRTFLASLLAAAALHAQVLLDGQSGLLLPEPPASLADNIGSLGFFTSKSLVWLTTEPQNNALAFLVLDADGSVVEPLDDAVLPHAGGFIFFEGDVDGAPTWPLDVWLRVLTYDDPAGPFLRSARFGFASSSASPLLVPEPLTYGALFASGLLGFAAYRSRGCRKALL